MKRIVKVKKMDRVTENELDDLMNWLLEQPWAIRFYDTDECVHISVRGIAEAEAKRQLAENEFSHIPVRIKPYVKGVFLRS